MPPRAKTVQALTLRIPVADYNLLRAEAFMRDRSINDVVLEAIKSVIEEPKRRERLEGLLAHVRKEGEVPGRGRQPPFTIQGKRGTSRHSR